MNEAMTETIQAIETGAQDTDDALTMAIPSVNETGTPDTAFAESAEMIWTGPHPAIAESAELIWSPAIVATADSGRTTETAQAAATAQLPATMVEATDTAQFIVIAPATGSEQGTGSEPGTGSAQVTETVPTSKSLQAARHPRGRHAAPRSAGSRPTAAVLAKRGGGRHAATRPAGGVARRFATCIGSAGMVAAGPSAVAS